MGVTRVLSLAIPANPADITILRTVTMAAVGRGEVPVEDVTDAGLAVDEAAGLLLSVPGTSRLRARLEIGSFIQLSLSSDGQAPLWPPSDYEGSIAETVISSLTSSVSFSDDEDGVGIAFAL